MTSPSGNEPGSGSDSDLDSNPLSIVVPANPALKTVQQVSIQSTAHKILHQQRTNFLLSSPEGLKPLARAHIYVNNKNLVKQHIHSAWHRRRIAADMDPGVQQEYRDMLAYVCPDSLSKIAQYSIDAEATYFGYHMRNPPVTPIPVEYDLSQPAQMDLLHLIRVRNLQDRAQVEGDVQLESSPLQKEIEFLKSIPRRGSPWWRKVRRYMKRVLRYNSNYQYEKSRREDNKFRPAPQEVQEYSEGAPAPIILSRTTYELAPEFYFNNDVTPLPGHLHGPFSLGWDTTVQKYMLDYDHGISKTFGLVDFPHHFQTKSPVDYTRSVPSAERFKVEQVIRCINEGGRFATTANTYICLHKEILHHFARRGGFNDIVDGAVDTRHLIDFVSGNKYHGRICPLQHVVNIGQHQDKFESLPCSDDLGDDDNNEDEDDYKNLMADNHVQLGRYDDLFEMNEPRDLHHAPTPMHRPEVTRWTSVTPEGILVPTHNLDHMELFVDIQVKCYSVIDDALFLTSGIRHKIFDPIKELYQQKAADEKRATGAEPPISEAEFVAQSTVFAVRILGSLCQVKGDHQMSPFLMGMGGWVSPPRFVRHFYAEENMGTGSSRESSGFFGYFKSSGSSGSSDYSESFEPPQASETAQPKSSQSSESPISSLELLRSLEAFQPSEPTEPSEPVEPAEPAEPAEPLATPPNAATDRAKYAIAKMAPLVLPDTLLDRNKYARYKSLIEPLSNELLNQSALVHTISTNVRPSDINEAKDLPQPTTKINLRLSPPSVDDEINAGECFYSEYPEAPVWLELADPTLEDVMWMAHRLMTTDGMRYFPAGRSDFGIDWDIKSNNAYGQQRAWKETCAFKSPSPMADAHSRMLWKAYNDGILERASLIRPQLPRPPRSDLLKPTLCLCRAPVTSLIEHCQGSEESDEEVDRVKQRLMFQLYTTAERYYDLQKTVTSCRWCKEHLEYIQF